MSDMITPTITVTTPLGGGAQFKLISAAFRDSFGDQPSTLRLNVAKGHTVLENSIVRYSVRGTIKLLGQVDKIDESSLEQDIIDISGHESLLNSCAMMPYMYPDTCTWAEMLSDDPPTTGGRVGLIYAFNSLFAKGSFVLYSGYKYKLTGGGTTRLGSTDIYENDIKLTAKTSIGAMVAGSKYQDANDLYVWLTDNVDPQYRLMSAPNWRDTRVRLGNIANGTSKFPVPYKVPADAGWNIIQAILYAMNLECIWRKEKDGYVYLDTAATVGRGTSTSGMAVFVEGMNGVEKVVLDVTSGQNAVNEVVVMGAGSGITQEGRSANDLSLTTIGQVWRSAIVSAPSCQGTMLDSVASRLLGERRDNKIWSVYGKADYHVKPGDYIEIKRRIRGQPAGVATSYLPSVFKRIKVIETKWPDNNMVVEAGRRQMTFGDAIKSQLDLLRTLSATAQSIATQWSESFDGNVDDAHPLTSTFDLPSDKIDRTFEHRFTLRIAIDPYEVDTSSVVTAAHNNGGVTGSHSGYGGGTSAKTQTAHGVNSFTGQAGSPSVTLGTGIYTDLAGGHSHSITANGYSTSTGTTSGHYHSYLYYVPSGSSTVSNHQHPIGYTSTAYVARDDHKHTIPPHSTQAAASQDHEWGTSGGSGGDAKSRQVFTEPRTPTEVMNYILNKDTGNSIHYLDVTVKVNGSTVPGTPVLDLYIGDDTGNLDITDLIQEGNNSVEVSIKDHDDPSEPVRCNINGSVGAEYYIDNYA